MKHIAFDDIVFGNPCKRDYDLIGKECYLDKTIPYLQKFNPPKNSSQVTVNELKALEELLSVKRDVKNNLYDEGLLGMIKDLFIDAGAEKDFVETVSKSIAGDVVPIITKLKYFFNRPRPAQLSYYYEMNFFPDFSFFVNSPSYPSGHVTLTVITAHVLGNLYPEAYRNVMPVINDVKNSRLYLGVHYPSDNDMAMVVSKAILDNAEFKASYRL
jgi:hypothetical protein